MYKSVVVHTQLELIKLKFFSLWNSLTECSKNERSLGQQILKAYGIFVAFLLKKEKNIAATVCVPF